ncbi:LEAF RUST 10 DISEASE-RESISTANCE LOCUS RECEPTOR-LIKE PROTEIN KINASE-like 1.2 [Chenopodium quinoa]|uniref:LEAF RUST 10 DISEASE-RESISTANCE LOCUS RECEPTOR-LIKE PROTEIN KINASE-like 1.2 n=1 Tax=Chenopodium quinoa TaxID=63459 RepID=UPI000B788028|nr:LEAF RUST 10 DISEASE-RESISTANCE LOCUS RECEPTOR-LIKE PROTEIN KINASE-like 1.2 [Chenopodium quinoa]
MSSYIFITIFTSLIIKTRSSDQNYTLCAPQSCGNLSSISYPFWIPSKQPSYCGHPSFNISCKNNTTPILRVSDNDYVITHVDYLNHTFHLVNAVVYNDSVTCPTPSNNLTLEHTPISFTTNSADFYLFYNCSNLPTTYYVYYPISCKAGVDNKNATYKSFGDFHFEDLIEQNYSLGLCESMVAVPVDLDMDVDSGVHGYGASSYWKMNYRQILSQGFTLNWTLNDCSVCKTSGGRCGLIDDKSVCFCKENTHPKTCHDGISSYTKYMLYIYFLC